MSMASKRLEELELSYDNNTSASFLVIKAGSNSQLLKYQALMISSNKISHVIAFEMKQNDGSSHFYYNITSRLPLVTFLKRRKLTRNEFIMILSDIAGTVVNSAGYLLSGTGFIFDARYIYMNPVTLDIQLVYVPLKREGDVQAGFIDFVIDLILNHAELEESDNDNFLQRILNFVKNELFNVSDFYLFLNKLNATHSKEVSKESSREASKEVSRENSLKDNEDKHRQKTQQLSIPLVVAALTLQAVIAVAFLLLGRYLKYAGNSSFTTYAALIMIALAIDVLLFKKLISLGLISSVNAPKEKAELTNKNKVFESDTIQACSSVNDSEFTGTSYITSDTDSKSNCNTIMLSQGRREHPCLLVKYGAEMEEIIIDKPEYLIGRLEGQVDYVLGNTAVGKVHACIKTKENNCFLSDLNSINGTFINNTRIDSNKEYEIKNNDIIAFANSQYVFVKP